MSRVVLYNKWRPQTFADVVGQEPTVRTLQNSLAAGAGSPRLYLCRDRGVPAKTSLARILAKALNCLQGVQPEPCGKLPSMHGHPRRPLSRSRGTRRRLQPGHRGHPRPARTREFCPCKRAVQILLDRRVHQLTPEASNALLKTLEEPPDHAVFVLATTEIHRVLPTILSRCQRFDFRRIPVRRSWAACRKSRTWRRSPPKRKP